MKVVLFEAFSQPPKLATVPDPSPVPDGVVVEFVVDLTDGGVHVSIDALGHPTTCFNSVSNLRKRGRHVQVGLLMAENSAPPVPEF